MEISGRSCVITTVTGSSGHVMVLEPIKKKGGKPKYAPTYTDLENALRNRLMIPVLTKKEEEMKNIMINLAHKQEVLESSLPKYTNSQKKALYKHRMSLQSAREVKKLLKKAIENQVSLKNFKIEYDWVESNIISVWLGTRMFREGEELPLRYMPPIFPKSKNAMMLLTSAYKSEFPNIWGDMIGSKQVSISKYKKPKDLVLYGMNIQAHSQKPTTDKLSKYHSSIQSNVRLVSSIALNQNNLSQILALHEIPIKVPTRPENEPTKFTYEYDRRELRVKANFKGT